MAFGKPQVVVGGRGGGGGGVEGVEGCIPQIKVMNQRDLGK